MCVHKPKHIVRKGVGQGRNAKGRSIRKSENIVDSEADHNRDTTTETSSNIPAGNISISVVQKWKCFGNITDCRIG